MRWRCPLSLAVVGLVVAGTLSAQEGTAPAVEAAPELSITQPTAAADREPTEIFLAGNAAYDRGDYALAILEYRQLVERGTADGWIHFNLGNAYLRNGELGRSIAEFRRARRLRPRDEDIRANLQFARESTTDAIAPPEPSAVLSTLLFWHYRLSPSELGLAAVALSGLFWWLAGLRLYRRRSELLGWLLIGVGVLLLGTLGSLAGHVLLSPQVAVVVPQEIEAFTAPKRDSVVRFKLHAGTELRVRDERQGWVRIVLPDGQQGWVDSSWVEIVEG